MGLAVISNVDLKLKFCCRPNCTSKGLNISSRKRFKPLPYLKTQAKRK